MNQQNRNPENTSDSSQSGHVKLKSSQSVPLDQDQEPPSPGFSILISDEQQTLRVDESRLRACVQSVLGDSCYQACTISIAIVDDPTIHDINRQFLKHDYPTDVISFVLEDDGSKLEGELVVSSDTAIQNAQEYGWPATDELLLYVLHGCLHLVGYRDKEPADQEQMHCAELMHLRKLGVMLPKDASRWLPLPSENCGKGSPS